MRAYLAIAASVVCSVAAQLILKRVIGSDGHMNFLGSPIKSYLAIFLSPLFVAGAVVYILSILLWIFVLSKVQLSFAYPAFVSASVVLTALGAWVFLGEQITLLRWIGMAIVGVGIYLVGGGA